jgi:uncharacterized membrane-anchored protein
MLTIMGNEIKDDTRVEVQSDVELKEHNVVIIGLNSYFLKDKTGEGYFTALKVGQSVSVHYEES